MVKITYKPPKEIIIFHCVELPLNELTKRFNMFRAEGQIVPLNWAEGVVFLSLPIPATDALEDYMEGKMLISDVVYSIMPKYEPTIGREIPVVDSTFDDALKELAKWLKEHSNQEKSKHKRTE